MEKLLITGGGGFVGANLISLVPQECQVFATYHYTEPCRDGRTHFIQLDVTDQQQVQDCIHDIRPDVIIHTAAITSLDACKNDADLAYAMNVKTTETIAVAAAAINARLIFTSTDLVYDGGRRYYCEADPAEPICVYGQTKRAAEEAIINSGVDHCIARVAMVYGWNLADKQNFTEFVIQQFSAGSPVKMFTEEHRTPVYVVDLCRVLLTMAQDRAMSGVYNVGGSKRVSRYELGCILSDVFGFDQHLVKEGTVEADPDKDPRPQDCSMNIDKLTEAIGDILSDVTEGRTAMKHQKG